MSTGASSEHQEALQCCVGDRALAQPAQRPWSRLREEKLPGYRPGHPTLGGPAGAWVGQDGPRGPSPLQLFCDSMMLNGIRDHNFFFIILHLWLFLCCKETKSTKSLATTLLISLKSMQKNLMKRSVTLWRKRHPWKQSVCLKMWKNNWENKDVLLSH